MQLSIYCLFHTWWYKLVTCFALLMLQIRYMQVSGAVLVIQLPSSLLQPPSPHQLTSPHHFISNTQHPTRMTRRLGLVTHAWWRGRPHLVERLTQGLWLQLSDCSVKWCQRTPPTATTKTDTNFVVLASCPASLSFFLITCWAEAWTGLSFSSSLSIVSSRFLIVNGQIWSRWLP